MTDALVTRVRRAVEELAPGYFSLVMATGIVSIGLRERGQVVVSDVLLAVAVLAYTVILALSVWRCASYPAAVAEDLADPRRAFGFFTFVAGTDVLAVRLGMTGGREWLVVGLAVAGTAWLVLGYVVPWTAVLGRSAGPVLRSADGTWFTCVVAAQSVAIVAASLEPGVHSDRAALALLAVGCWSVGVLLYLLVGLVVVVRLLLHPIGPEELTPPYWVSMGALAITVVAGARIVEMTAVPVVEVTRGLVAGLAVVLWSVATWLVPALVAAGCWRHLRHRVPLDYEPSLWNVVFPLGMYAVAGIDLGEADHLPIVARVGDAVVWVALAAWVVLLVAMVRHLLASAIRPPGPQPAT
ncbi:tellurite resistance/C4-dicarboxylate transporter family protein [Nocardioides sp. MH1]|uniref:tellurite resistance/C4-dicarboxylate transporter family protein n=1 Tax=Nocardioides sp. MH1 TaxID=3242490 RepID=UPI00351FAF7E